MRLVPLLLAMMTLGVVVNFVVPLDWGPDEPQHVEYVHVLAYEHRLPDRQDTHIVQHPPLFYALLAIPWRLMGAGQRPLSIAPGVEAARAMTPAAKRARRVLRFLQTLLACVSLWLMARILHDLEVPPRLALTWLGIAAVWPMFGYLSGVVNNENAAIAFSCLVCWLIVRRTLANRCSPADAMALGLLCGAGVLVKQTTLFVWPIALWCIWSCGERAQRARRALLFAAVSVALGIWWPLHNVLVAGEPFPSYTVPPDQFALSFREKLFETPNVLRLLLETSFWPDWASRFLPREIAFAATLLLGAMMAILLFATRRNARSGDSHRTQRRVQSMALAAIVLLVLGLLQYIVCKDYRAQIGGRYLLNGLPWLIAYFGASLSLLRCGAPELPLGITNDGDGGAWVAAVPKSVTWVSALFLAAMVLIAAAWWFLAWTYFVALFSNS